MMTMEVEGKKIEVARLKESTTFQLDSIELSNQQTNTIKGRSHLLDLCQFFILRILFALKKSRKIWEMYAKSLSLDI